MHVGRIFCLLFGFGAASNWPASCSVLCGFPQVLLDFILFMAFLVLSATLACIDYNVVFFTAAWCLPAFVQEIVDAADMLTRS